MTPGQTDGPDAPLTDLDTAILAGIRQAWEAADPMPPDLIDRVQFAIDLNAVNLEVSRLIEFGEPAAARTDEHTRLITFQSASLSLMISLEPSADGTTRIDGWITPSAPHRVELRAKNGSRSAEADAEGRFSLDAITPGLWQLVVHLEADDRRVITPTMHIGQRE
jgi:hypothetical protein